MGAVAVLVVPFLLPYMDKQLVQNQYAVGIEIGVVSLLVAFVAMFVREKVKAKEGKDPVIEKQGS